MLSISYLAAAVVIRRTRQPRVRHLRATALNIGFFLSRDAWPRATRNQIIVQESRQEPTPPPRPAAMGLALRRVRNRFDASRIFIFIFFFLFPVKDNRLARGRQRRSRGLPQQPVNLDARARAALPAKTPSLSRTGSRRSNLLVRRMGGAARDSSDLGN